MGLLSDPDVLHRIIIRLDPSTSPMLNDLRVCPYASEIKDGECTKLEKLNAG